MFAIVCLTLHPIELKQTKWAMMGLKEPIPSCVNPRPKLNGNLDEDIVSRLVGIGFNRNEVVEDLLG